MKAIGQIKPSKIGYRLLLMTTFAVKASFKMPQFVANSKSSFVLNARSTNKKLVGFYAVDLAATQFADYINQGDRVNS